MLFPRFMRAGERDPEPLTVKICRENCQTEPKRVLFLEDNQGLADLLAYGIFPKFDVQVEQATNVEDAKRIMQDHPVAAAILDIRLNEAQSGVDFYKWCVERFPAVDVCFLSAHATDANKAAIESIGPARVFAKGRLSDESFVTNLMFQFGIPPKTVPAQD